MAALIISILMLAIAPGLYVLAKRAEKIWRIFDYLLIAAVGALVILHLLPEALRVIGFYALILALLGLMLPSLSERLFAKNAQRIHLTSVLVGVFGLAGHGVLDGAALSVKPVSGASIPLSWLSLAVLLHRIPAGFLIWSIFYPKKGAKFSALILFSLALFTIIGFFLGEKAFNEWLNRDAFFSVQALTSGTLLHLVLDRHEDGSHEEHDHG